MRPDKFLVDSVGPSRHIRYSKSVLAVETAEFASPHVGEQHRNHKNASGRRTLEEFLAERMH
jgi:hypothetical protein